MALVPAIEFRNLLDQLTAEETDSFIADLTKSHPQLIIELLSSRFINQSSTGTTNPLNSHCIDSISTIILSRDPDKNSTASNDVKLNTLPLRLIGLLSSYLDQKSNRRLSVCSRSTYLGTNSPIMLQELDVSYSFQSDCRNLDLSLFPMVNALALGITTDIDIEEKAKFIASQMAKMPRLESLNLFRLDDEVDAVNIIANEEAINRQIQGLHIDYRCISSLSAFKNLRFLYLNIDDEDATASDSDMTAMVQTLPHLVGLELIDCPSPFGAQLLAAIGHQLEYLSLNWFEDADLRSTNFGNLTQFQMFDRCSMEMSKEILKTASNLEKARITFDRDYENVNVGCILIQQMLGQFENLVYLEIAYEMFIDQIILDAIHRGLSQGKKYEKRELKIKIYEADHVLDLDEDLIMKCVRIINQLSNSKVKQWMLLLPGTDIMEKLYDSVTCDVRISEDNESNLTVITNRDCFINGYSAGWVL